MFYFLIKTVLSAVIIAAISEIAKRSPGFAALVASLPLVSILGILWLWRDTGDTERISAHSEATFWFVIPSLPMFLLLPFLLRHGVSFYVAMTGCIVFTVCLYFTMTFVLKRFGIIL
ncbi:MAG: DUF3147 family protein [Alphaproteobacteria bacterium PRO2]|nr:DUF3147 family protein [Alphaproteobacteria bacterium PRO2]